MLRASFNYGPLVGGIAYKLINQGTDWVQVSCMGRSIYAPCWVFSVKDKFLS